MRYCFSHLKHHCLFSVLQILQQKFEEFLREVAAYEEHIDHINQTSDALTASGHSESPTIQQEQRHVNYLWSELKDLANGRLEVSAVLRVANVFICSVPWPVKKEIELTLLQAELRMIHLWH